MLYHNIRCTDAHNWQGQSGTSTKSVRMPITMGTWWHHIDYWYQEAWCSHALKNCDFSFNRFSLIIGRPPWLTVIPAFTFSQVISCFLGIGDNTNIILSLSLHFNGCFPGELGLAGVYWSKGWWNWWWHVDKSCSQIITTNKATPSLFFTGRIPFLSPNQQCQRTEEKISHSVDLLTPNSPGGSSNFVSDHE